jgi:PAS domain S-box-containing protein
MPDTRSPRDTSRTLEALVAASPLAIVVIDAEQRVQLWSPAAERMFGWTAEEAIGEILPIVPESEVPNMRATRPDSQHGVERRRLRKDGTFIDISLWSAPLRAPDGSITGTLGVIADMTTRNQLERQMRQSQKLDALGTIAGGIAHDFNNILTVLRGNLSLAQLMLPGEHEVQASLTEMDQACRRAAELVKQILTFGRRREQSRAVIALEPAMHEALKLLRATVPTGIEIRCDLATLLPTVMADATQIHQVVMNLGINAAQAIGSRHGTIEVKLAAVDVNDALAATCPELNVRRYVRLSVADTGCGMSAATQERMFEPFFTTRAAGQGTGLGLAVVRGIVKGHDGAITVVSEEGKGTSFEVYFPVVLGEVDTAEHEALEPLHGRGERILFLDDEEALGRLAQRLLERIGYRISTFTRWADALRVFQSDPQAFDLVLTDFSMPGASGIEFARKVLALRPGMPVILTTGYIDADDLAQAREAGISEVIMKPTTVEEMGRAFRRLLGESQPELAADTPA